MKEKRTRGKLTQMQLGKLLIEPIPSSEDRCLGRLSVEVRSEFYGTSLISSTGDGSCEASQPPPSASINAPLAVIC